MKPQELQTIKQRFGIVGSSPRLNEAIQRAVQVAETDLSVLITGESGTGKESFSKIIHSLSRRKHGPFIAINCGAIPEGTIYSELFGHEKGSFTGSTDMRRGYFEVVDGGTIFLDEIGEMPLSSQSMLLRILENGEFIRMGSSKPLKTDVRVVAATNVDMQQALLNKKFREDLYYRLSTVPIFVPALRDREDDLPLLFRKFATDFAEKYRVQPVRLTESGVQALFRYRFPGNIRQLKNLAEQIALLEEEGAEIDEATIQKYLPDQEKNNLLAHFSNNRNQEEFSERELLYKILFEMRNDVTELKKLVYQLLQNGTFSPEIIQNHPTLFAGIEEDYEGPALSKETLVLKNPPVPIDQKVIEIRENPHRQDFKTHDVSHEEENDSLSLEEKERELIVLALKRNHNKRKYAAQDLGISERTLYRKIKQYEIENQ
ncbi:MAG: sigma-54-dependent Fis family transcriptional regulator [Microscillaceae bacterium]|nr:sigma-54-dependent Fis family transcriptional regulator [Microscillaceae bacterium]